MLVAQLMFSGLRASLIFLKYAKNPSRSTLPNF